MGKSGWAWATSSIFSSYDRQTEEEAVAEDEAAFRRRDQTVMVVPKILVPAITLLIERQVPGRQAGSRRPNELRILVARSRDKILG
jgi:hypothetical protein